MAVDLPPNAIINVPVLAREICQHWPALAFPYYLGAQVEQESCVSLKSKKCWSATAELKTSREYGFGLGQLTVTSRFNNFDAALKLDKSFSGWKWEARFDASYQLRALVLMDQQNFESFPLSANTREQIAFALAAYNGGRGGVLNDMKLCGATKGCDSARWFGNVEKTSLKTRLKWQGYGKSAFDINREYVYNIIYVRFGRYVRALPVGLCGEKNNGMAAR